MKNLISIVILIVTVVLLSVCPCVPSALASTLDTSGFLLAQTQPTPKPSPSSSPQSQSNVESSDSEKSPVLQAPAQLPSQTVNWSNLILLVTPIVSSSLLMAMVLWVAVFQSKPPKQNSSADPNGTHDTSQIGPLTEKGDFIAKSFPPVIEGITVYLIVAVVAVLSLSATIRPEGTLTIISGISGYVLGKQTSGGGRS